jgi:mRNA-degrading endonuclease RelE of RelBE toxin-antitoxin system
MDRIEKALKKLSAQEKVRVKQILQKLYSGNIKELEIKKLKGREDVFRVRKGKLRIIYHIRKDSSIYILAIERRSDTTY